MSPTPRYPSIPDGVRRGARKLLPLLHTAAREVQRDGVGPLVRRGRVLLAHVLAPDVVAPGTAMQLRPPTVEPVRPGGATTDQAVLRALILDMVRSESAAVGRGHRALDLLQGRRDLDEEAQKLVFAGDEALTQVRRGHERLLMLAGERPVDDRREVMTLFEVIDEAIASVEGYQRVTFGSVVALAVVADAAHDLARLLVELLRNATERSTGTVKVSAHLTEQGSILIRVEDAGVGVRDDELLAELNVFLAADAVLDVQALRYKGLAVVRLLARRHGMRAALHERSPHGLTAVVALPPTLTREPDPEPGTRPGPASEPVPPPVDTARPMRAVQAPAEAAVHLSGDLSVASTTRPAPLTPVSSLRPAPRHLRDEDAPSSTTVGGLPVRAPGSFVQPAPVRPETSDSDGVSMRSPEEVRDGLAALQSGVRRARETPDEQTPATPPAPGGQPRDEH